MIVYSTEKSNILGVRKDTILDFYVFEENQWKPRADATYYLPYPAQDVAVAPPGLFAVHRDSTVMFYFPAWFGFMEKVDSLDFNAGQSIDEMVYAVSGYMGLRFGLTLRFYYYNHEWTHMPQYDFQLPEETKSIFLTVPGHVGVITDRSIQFFMPGEPYKLDSSLDFTLPGDTDEVFITHGNEIGIRSDHLVRFYMFKEKWEYIPGVDFHIPE